MAPVLNPLTGQMEDDGTGQPETAGPPAQPTGLEPALPDQATFASGGGGAPTPALPVAPAAPRPAPAAPAPVPLAVPVLSAKPEFEQHRARRVESTDSKAATANLGAARTAQEAAADKEAEAKLKEQDIRASDAETRRLMEERRQIQFKLAESEKKQKVAENLAADKAAVEASANDESVKNSAGNLTGVARVFSTLMIAIGDAGQTLAALGHRGTSAFQDENPIAAYYEKERQKRLAAGKADFEKNERVRALRKQGRDAELKVLEDRLTIGINNEFQRDVQAQDAGLAVRLAKQGIGTQRAASELLKAGRGVVNANIDRENAQGYESTLTTIARSPTGAGGANARMADDTAVFDAKTGAKLFDATTPAQAKELNDNGATMARVSADTLRYRDLMKEIPKLRDPTGLTNTDDLNSKIQQAENTKQRIIGQMTQMTGAGAPSGTEKTDFVKSLERSTAQSAESHFDALTKLADQFDNTYREALPAYGYKAGKGEGVAKTDLGRRAEGIVKGTKGGAKYGPVETRLFQGKPVKVRLNNDTGKYDEVE